MEFLARSISIQSNPKEWLSFSLLLLILMAYTPCLRTGSVFLGLTLNKETPRERSYISSFIKFVTIIMYTALHVGAYVIDEQNSEKKLS